MHTMLHSVPLTLQQATTDPSLCQRLLNTHRQVWVSCGVTAPFSWVLVHIRFCLCPLRVYFQSFVSSGSSMVGLMVTSSKRAYSIPKSASPSHAQVCCTQSPCPRGGPPLTCTSTGDTQTQFCLSLCGVSGSWCTKVCLSPLSIPGVYGD